MIISQDWLYKGWTELWCDGDAIDRLYDEGMLPPDDYAFTPNEFAILKNPEKPSHSAIARYNSQSCRLLPLRSMGVRPWGVEPLNAGQTMLLDLLLDPEIKLVTSPSPAGTGKNVLAFAAGLHQVVEEKTYEHMIVYKPIVPVGRDLGYLPGELKDKLAPYHASSYGTLDFIFSRNRRVSKLSHDYLESAGVLELSSLTHIRGLSLPRRFIIIDEAQNIDIKILKTALTRAAEGTKVVLLGHPGQIDEAARLTPQQCGIAQATGKFVGQPIFGTVTLTQCVRSELARLADTLL